jgi:hypothetical protein
MEDYRVTLVQMAREMAMLPFGSALSAGDEPRFLRRFRTIYQHLAITVETSGGGAMPNPMMGMDPFMRSPDQVRDLIDRSDANLSELER